MRTSTLATSAAVVLESSWLSFTRPPHPFALGMMAQLPMPTGWSEGCLSFVLRHRLAMSLICTFDCTQEGEGEEKDRSDL